MSSALFRLCTSILARKRLIRLNRFLYSVSLRGLGVLNFESLGASGEALFLETVMRQYCLPGLPAPVVLDVGANIGAYARAVMGIAPEAHIHCFEPHPNNVAKLASLRSENVTIVDQAVGAESGTLELFDYLESDGSSHASVYKEVFEQIHRRPHVSHRVPVTTIDSYMSEHGLQSVALLKIDTEGHELAALQGARRVLAEERIDIVHFEFNEMNVASRTFLGDFFAALPRYQIFRLLPDGWMRLHDRPIDNIYAFQNIVAVRVGSRAESIFGEAAV
jgi:FkbM family methyltransferase